MLPPTDHDRSVVPQTEQASMLRLLPPLVLQFVCLLGFIGLLLLAAFIAETATSAWIALGMVVILYCWLLVKLSAVPYIPESRRNGQKPPSSETLLQTLKYDYEHHIKLKGREGIFHFTSLWLWVACLWIVLNYFVDPDANNFYSNMIGLWLVIALMAIALTLFAGLVAPTTQVNDNTEIAASFEAVKRICPPLAIWNLPEDEKRWSAQHMQTYIGKVEEQASRILTKEALPLDDG